VIVPLPSPSTQPSITQRRGASRSRTVHTTRPRRPATRYFSVTCSPGSSEWSVAPSTPNEEGCHPGQVPGAWSRIRRLPLRGFGFGSTYIFGSRITSYRAGNAGNSPLRPFHRLRRAFFLWLTVSGPARALGLARDPEYPGGEHRRASIAPAEASVARKDARDEVNHDLGRIVDAQEAWDPELDNPQDHHQQQHDTRDSAVKLPPSRSPRKSTTFVTTVARMSRQHITQVSGFVALLQLQTGR
jgi:hypothetical protein